MLPHKPTDGGFESTCTPSLLFTCFDGLPTMAPATTRNKGSSKSNNLPAKLPPFKKPPKQPTSTSPAKPTSPGGNTHPIVKTAQTRAAIIIGWLEQAGTGHPAYTYPLIKLIQDDRVAARDRHRLMGYKMARHPDDPMQFLEIPPFGRRTRTSMRTYFYCIPLRDGEMLVEFVDRWGNRLTDLWNHHNIQRQLGEGNTRATYAGNTTATGKLPPLSDFFTIRGVFDIMEECYDAPELATVVGSDDQLASFFAPDLFEQARAHYNNVVGGDEDELPILN